MLALAGLQTEPGELRSRSGDWHIPEGPAAAVRGPAAAEVPDFHISCSLWPVSRPSQENCGLGQEIGTSRRDRPQRGATIADSVRRPAAAGTGRSGERQLRTRSGDRPQRGPAAAETVRSGGSQFPDLMLALAGLQTEPRELRTRSGDWHIPEGPAAAGSDNCGLGQEIGTSRRDRPQRRPAAAEMGLARVQQLHRISQIAEVTDFEVQVRAGGVACRPHIADYLSLLYLVTGLNETL